MSLQARRPRKPPFTLIVAAAQILAAPALDVSGQLDLIVVADLDAIGDPEEEPRLA